MAVQRTLAGTAAVASRAERFSEVSDKAVQCCLKLQAEQSRTWFKAHQADDLRLCRHPLELLASDGRKAASVSVKQAARGTAA